MGKKNWIYVKRGLSEDPKHREAMGMAVWLFLHICDAADFETGIVYDWRDKGIGIDMTLSTNTIREWRSRLVEKGYITCKQRQHGIEIVIHNWTNPRDYSGKKVNIQGDMATTPSKINAENKSQGEAQGEAQALQPSTINKTLFHIPESESLIYTAPDDDFAKVKAKLEATLKIVLNSVDAQRIELWNSLYSTERIFLAIDKSIGHPSTGYVDAVLKNWRDPTYPNRGGAKQKLDIDAILGLTQNG